MCVLRKLKCAITEPSQQSTCLSIKVMDGRSRMGVSRRPRSQALRPAAGLSPARIDSTVLASRTYTAFWSATAKFLKWAGEIAIFQHWMLSTPPLLHWINSGTELRIRQPQQGDAGDVVPMLAAFLDTHRHLLEQGILEYNSLAVLH